MVITTAQLHSTKSELRFCAGLKSPRGVSDICDCENLWQWSRLEIRRKRPSSNNHSAKTIHHHIIMCIMWPNFRNTRWENFYHCNLNFIETWPEKAIFGDCSWFKFKPSCQPPSPPSPLSSLIGFNNEYDTSTRIFKSCLSLRAVIKALILLTAAVKL